MEIKRLKIRVRLKRWNIRNMDIKSLKKAARQTIGPELNKRIDQIIKTGLLKLKMILKFIGENSIAIILVKII